MVDVSKNGEPLPRIDGIIGVAAAVANAVFDATGIRVRDLPIRVEALLA